MDLKPLASLTCIACVLSVNGTVFAQAEIVPEDELAGATDDDVVGWNPSLSVSGSINLVDNSNVVGQVEGTSMLFGLGLAGAADYINGPSVVRTELKISEGFAKTPVVDRFVKTTDELALSSTYNYFLTKVMGGFGRAKIATSLFKARAITADPVTYTILPAEMGGMSREVTSDQLKVASALKPFTVTESVGGFAEPVRTKEFNLRLRAGLGGRHTFASDVFVENDDDTTPNVELQELTNVHQAGVELFAGVQGKAKEDRVSYEVGASVLVPFINNDDYDRSSTELTRFALEGSLTVSVFDWMGLVYKGALVRDPQLFPDGQELTQVQNSLLLTFQYTLIDRQKGLAALKAAAAEEKAKKEKEEAEKRAKEAEERAKELERELEEAKRREEEAKKREQEEPATQPSTQPSGPPDPNSGTDASQADGTSTPDEPTPEG